VIFLKKGLKLKEKNASIGVKRLKIFKKFRAA
jgi:hypothetical protein